MTAAKPGISPARLRVSRQQLPTACQKARATDLCTTPPARRSQPISFTTARSIPGSSSASGISSRRSPILTRSTPESKMRLCSNPPMAARTGRNCPASADTGLDRTGSPAQEACACTRSSSIPKIRTASTSRSRRPGPSALTTAARIGGQSIRACTQSTFPIQPLRSVTACTILR